MAYVVSAGLMIFAAILTFFTKAPGEQRVVEREFGVVPVGK
jgi:uncharacterized membrane protein